MHGPARTPGPAAWPSTGRGVKAPWALGGSSTLVGGGHRHGTRGLLRGPPSTFLLKGTPGKLTHTPLCLVLM